MSTKFVSSPDRHSDLFKTTTEQVDALDNLSINTIRTLSIDAVQQAKSGHPGTPMALAPVMYTLWQRFLRFDPDNPTWPNRDRFVLSNGHASMLLYAMLHLAEVKPVNRNNQVLDRPAVTLDDIKRFRQLDGRCPGHPEYGVTTGVETTTGPLGQGCGDSVGMALASSWLAQHFNRPDFVMFDFQVYAFCSDGDMMEGVSSEAASLAGHLGLGNLCWIYDSNRITIEGKTDRFQRGRTGTVSCLRLDRTKGRQRQRHRAIGVFPSGVQAWQQLADIHHRQQPHRVWCTPQAGHQRGAW